MFIIFVTWKRGPTWYLRISPYIYFLAMFTNYILLPLFNLGVFLYFTIHPDYDLKQEPLESWVIFFCIVCFSRLIEYVSTVRKLLSEDYAYFKAMKKRLAEPVLEQTEATEENKEFEENQAEEG